MSKELLLQATEDHNSNMAAHPHCHLVCFPRITRIQVAASSQTQPQQGQSIQHRAASDTRGRPWSTLNARGRTSATDPETSAQVFMINCL